MTSPVSWPSSVRPRWATPRSPDRPSYGPAIGRLAAAFGEPFMPWQQAVADVGTEMLPDGSWAYGVVIVHVQRQAGKTTLFGPVACHRCLTRPDAKAWLTAQTGGDARDTWLEVDKRVHRSPLRALVTSRRANGTEAMAFPNGATFRPFPPTEEAMHGKANELVAVDEGWAFSDEAGTALEAAITPTFTTTGGQLWIISAGGTAKSAWLLRHVLAGRAAAAAGVRTGIAYFEYGVDDDTAAAIAAGLDVEAGADAFEAAIEATLAAHPAAGYTLRRDALVSAARSMKPGEFLRAYANHWTRAGERIVPAALWDAGRRAAWPPPEGGRLALGFAASIDQRDAAIVAAWRDGAGGALRVDVIDARAGIDWLAPRLVELAGRWRPAAIGHDSAGPALDVADELSRARLSCELVPTSTRDYAAACSALLRAITTGTLEHPGQPALDGAVEAAARRLVGDGLWMWSRRTSSASIAPLEAATVAGWAFDHAPAPAAAPLIVASRPRPPAAGRPRPPAARPRPRRAS
jgi:hypothetical protein